ncbi:MAG: hypothetical protein ACTSWN_08910 [Promethearchaeota archaeon]
MNNKTIASLVSLNRPIELPASAKDILKKKNALLILPDSGKKILLFPTDSEKIVRISLELVARGLSPLFFNKIGDITKNELKANILYTTGLCFAEEKCVWDGFFEDYEKFDGKMDEIKKKFKEISGVNKVEIDYIEL